MWGSCCLSPRNHTHKVVFVVHTTALLKVQRGASHKARERPCVRGRRRGVGGEDNGNMGKITNLGLADVKVKVQRNPGSAPCGAEMVSYIACLDVSGGDDSKCGNAREVLGKCMQAAMASGASKRKHKAPINFHLKQFLRNVKR